MESTRSGVTNFAAGATTPAQPHAPPIVSVVVLGTDAVLAASPSTPVQLAHACMRAGFANVIPASWGDELIAAAILRRLPQYGSSPVIQCSCPIVAHRVLSAGGDLRSVLLPLVPPPVAVARYLRAIARPSRVRITYVGSCPGANDDSIDIRMSPESLITMLEERGIVLANQPQAFESIIPPDRRRFRSQPGGVPSADALWTELGSRTLVELHEDDFVTELAQVLLTGKSVLIDAAARLGCVCSGAVGASTDPRARIVALEPPRSPAPVVEEQAPVDLDLPVPAVTRTPVEVTAIPAKPSRTSTVVVAPSPVDAVVAAPQASNGEAKAGRPTPSSVVPRPVISAFPLAKDVEGKALPRAYVARRRVVARGPSRTAPEERKSEAPPPLSMAADTKPPVEAEASLPSTIPDAPVAPVPEQPQQSPQPATDPTRPHGTEVPTNRSVADGGPVERPTEAPGRVTQPTPPRAARPVGRPASRPLTPPKRSLSLGQILLIFVAVAAIAICASTVVGVIMSRSGGVGIMGSSADR